MVQWIYSLRRQHDSYLSYVEFRRLLSLTFQPLPRSVFSLRVFILPRRSAALEKMQREPKCLYTNLVGILEMPPLQFRIPLVLRLAYVCSTACNPSSTSSSWNKTRAAAANDSLAAPAAAVADAAADPAVPPSPPTPSMTAAVAAPNAGTEAAASGNGAEKSEVGISSGFRFGDEDEDDDDDDEDEEEEEEEEEEGDEADPGCLSLVGSASLDFFRDGDVLVLSFFLGDRAWRPGEALDAGVVDGSSAFKAASSVVASVPAPSSSSAGSATSSRLRFLPSRTLRRFSVSATWRFASTTDFLCATPASQRARTHSYARKPSTSRTSSCGATMSRMAGRAIKSRNFLSAGARRRRSVRRSLSLSRQDHGPNQRGELTDSCERRKRLGGLASIARTLRDSCGW